MLATSRTATLTRYWWTASLCDRRRLRSVNGHLVPRIPDEWRKALLDYIDDVPANLAERVIDACPRWNVSLIKVGKK